MNFQNTQNQKGFTLIELIIVIIILGILAVTAAPKFLDISEDANESTVTGVQGALQAASQLVRSKGRIDGVDATDEFDGSNDATILLDGTTITLDEGVAAPFATNVLAMLDITGGTRAATTDNLTAFDFVAVQDNATDNAATTVRIYPVGAIDDSINGTFDTTNPSLCYVSYTYDASGSATAPTISVPAGFTC